jgi:hypothetical protein
MGVFSSAIGRGRQAFSSAVRSARSSPRLVNAEAAAIKYSPFSSKGRMALKGIGDRGFAALTKPVNYRQALYTQAGAMSAGALYGGMTADDGHGFRGMVTGAMGGAALGMGVNAARIYGPRFHSSMRMKGGYGAAMSRGGKFNLTRARRNIGVAASHARAYPNAEGSLLGQMSMFS